MFNLLDNADAAKDSPKRICSNCGRGVEEGTVCPCFYDEP